MKIIVQVEAEGLLFEALKSNCHGVRFGPEFCELKLPRLETLRVALKEAKKAGKEFVFVTPILTNTGIAYLRELFTYLDEAGGCEVVVGDLGVLRIIQSFKNLQPRLGRLRVYIPARCPWKQITRMQDISILEMRKVEKIFYQTSLNYNLMLEFLASYGIHSADFDWIPRCFEAYARIARKGLKLAVHAFEIPVAVTGRCHMARFIREDPNSCGKQCLERAFLIIQKELNVSFLLCGNVVFRHFDHKPEDVRKLRKAGINEIILHMNPISNLSKAKDVDEAIASLGC
jgi:hypothetical protein